MICAATRAEALGQLAGFVPRAALYARDRNHVREGHGGVSRLSAAIRHRLLTEDEVAEAVLGAHSFPRVEKFVQEVYWRRYWKAWLSLRPQVWADYVKGLAELERDERAARVEAGDSGNAIIDHFSRELLETGYLHNHVRMWYAAWWIHVAGLPWQAGADFFLRHLLDGDPASNTLSWRWVAGLQTPGKTYLARRGNLEKYLAAEVLEEFSGAWGDFEEPRARVLEAGVSHLVTCPELTVGKVRDGVRTGLWIHEEDLTPERSPLGERAVEAVLVTADVDFPGPKRKWLEAAVRDSAARAEERWKGEVVVEMERKAGDALVDWAVRRGIDQVVALRPEVGPLGDAVAGLVERLGARGIGLVLVDRPRDLALRPLATGGFFKFWETMRKRGLVAGVRSMQPELF